MKIKDRELFSVSLFVFLTACSTTPVVSPTNLAQQWGDRLRAYQINPVFPPREDMQVGDVYLLCDLKSGADPATALNPSGPTPQSVWVTRLNLSPAVETNYATAISLPALSAQNAKGALSDPSGIGSMPTTNDMVAGKRKLQQLRNVSFPEFFSASITSVQANALVPAGTVLAGLGLAKDDIAAISLSVPSAGSYGLPVMAAHLAFNNAIQPFAVDFWRYTTELKRAYATKCNENQTASLELVTEIFAAYAMDVNFTFEKGAAGRMQAAINTPANSTRNATLQALTKQISDLQATAINQDDTSGKGSVNHAPASKTKSASAAGAASGASVPGDASSAGGTNAGKSQQTQVDQLNTLLNLLVQQAAGFEQQKFAGVSAQIVSGSSSGVRVERVFSNPVVIGYKSITLFPYDKAESSAGANIVSPPDANPVSKDSPGPVAPANKNPHSPAHKGVTPNKNKSLPARPPVVVSPRAENPTPASAAEGGGVGIPILLPPAALLNPQ
ncbi:hypothetical protein BTHE68_71230 (plasmid) [Burkholderia sp. THE68]|uniref:hypothetical protein n=1 Tax=Burkholderia sp. THE68 TaxID=758782 RepID=UPI001318B0FB|nr:hypothetical protein [Burkholderia sp. THE68]BBU33389.1 hypothetical protein BTHE68_71230 [Burkholderia sp. THE68]